MDSTQCDCLRAQSIATIVVVPTTFGRVNPVVRKNLCVTVRAMTLDARTNVRYVHNGPWAARWGCCLRGGAGRCWLARQEPALRLPARSVAVLATGVHLPSMCMPIGAPGSGCRLHRGVHADPSTGPATDPRLGCRSTGLR